MTVAVIAPDLHALAVPVEGLCLLPGNPRRGDIGAVAASLAKFGQRKPIVVRRTDRTVVAGNHTLQAAQELGWSEIAVVWVDDDDATAKAFALADNRTAELGGYDDQALADLIAEVQTADAELLAATGWSSADLADLLVKLEAEADPPPDPADDDVPVAAPALTVPGDVWLLGHHRVMCGDSTVPTDVERLMADGVADIVWTDPPYGLDYVGGNHEYWPEERRKMGGGTVQNDALTPEALGSFLHLAFTLALGACRPGAAWYCAAPASPMLAVFCVELERLGVWRQTMVWVKDSLVMGRCDYHYRHEMLFYGWAPGAAHRPPPDRTHDTVWEIPRPKRSTEHPTMKPVELITRALRNSSAPGDLVLDPFGGSGSTLIAAHASNRVAYLMELDPAYVDVICRRYQDRTGEKPIAEATGNPHDFSA